MTFQATELGYLFPTIVNARDLGRFSELVAPDYINHNQYAEPGLAGVRQVFGAILAGVPDLQVTAEDVFATEDGSRVVGRYRYGGTHTGNFLGYPPTGKPIAMRSIDIWRVQNGLFVEHWDELNMLEVFTSIGAIEQIALTKGE